MSNQLKGIIIRGLKILGEFYLETPVLIPKPKEVSKHEKGKGCILTSEANICFLNAEHKKLLLNDLNQFLKEISNVQIKEVKFDIADKIVFQSKSERDLLELNNEECYNLEINEDNLLIYSTSNKGLFYGIQTLIQLCKGAFLTNKNLISFSIDQRKSLSLPFIQIKDAPDLKIRGIAQDISRGQVFTVENAKRYIKILSHYKMNFYCIYLEDMFAHPKHQLIGKNRGALTCEEIKQIDEFAKERYIELVPIFECLGHVDNILQHKEYEELGEFPGAHCLNISNPKIYDFLNDYISEISKCFSTNYFHIGCDESFDIGRYHSREFIKKQGKGKILTDFYEKVYKIAKNHDNEKIVMYDDIVRKNDDILRNLNKDLILMYWDYAPKKSFPDLEKLLNAGYKVIVSPSMLNWQRHFPDNKSASKNIINFIKAAYDNRKKGCLGVLTSTWGDMRYYSFRENEIFGAILNGASSWTCSDFDYDQFINEYGFLFYGLERALLSDFSKMFSLLSISANTYYRLSILLPPLFFTYLFKHPFPAKEYKSPFENYVKLGNLANECLELYNKIKSKVLFELKNFEYIEFAAELCKYLREKIDLSIKVSHIINNSELNKENTEKIISELNSIKEKTLLLRNKFETLWLRAAKYNCLDNVLKLFDFLAQKYEEKINQIKQGKLFEDPYIKAEWIWSSKIDNPLSPRYFRKTFEIKQPIKKAIIQGIACNHMKIYLNNEYIGEVLGRYSMSILPIALRVRTFDITNKIKQGKNIIAIEAYNYDKYKGAINLYGQIRLNDNTVQEIITDNTWIYLYNKIDDRINWRDMNYIDKEWKEVHSYGRPPKLNGDIFNPDLLNGEKSETQDFFSIESYFSNFTDEYDEKALNHMINIFNPYGN